jgi:hypothetical protein
VLRVDFGDWKGVERSKFRRNIKRKEFGVFLKWCENWFFQNFAAFFLYVQRIIFFCFNKILMLSPLCEKNWLFFCFNKISLFSPCVRKNDKGGLWCVEFDGCIVGIDAWFSCIDFGILWLHYKNCHIYSYLLNFMAFYFKVFSWNVKKCPFKNFLRFWITKFDANQKQQSTFNTFIFSL